MLRPVSHIAVGVMNCLHCWLPCNVLSCKFGSMQMPRRRMQARKHESEGWPCEIFYHSFKSIHSRL